VTFEQHKNMLRTRQVPTLSSFEKNSTPSHRASVASEFLLGGRGTKISICWHKLLACPGGRRAVLRDPTRFKERSPPKSEVVL